MVPFDLMIFDQADRDSVGSKLERGRKTGVTAPGEGFAPAWHRSRPPSLDRRAVTRH
jgi:hypothetical protein